MFQKIRNVKTVMKRLKDGNYTPCPWIPANRSPLKKKKPSNGLKVKCYLLLEIVAILCEF